MSHLHTALLLLLAVTSLVASNAALPFTRSGLPAPVCKPNHAEEYFKKFREQRLAQRGGSVSSTVRDSSAFISPALVKAIGTTTITYMIADFFSNFLQHPTQKMDYGVFNKYIGREVDQKWWGTRTEHIGT